jgi:predicted nucleic acid-binding protein
VIVLDSSAATDLLLRLEPGPWVEERLLADADVHAPHLLDVEVVSAISRLVRRRVIPLERGADALADLPALDVARYPHVPLLRRIWQLSSTFTAYDAAFVALADALGATLVTTDLRLARLARSVIDVASP